MRPRMDKLKPQTSGKGPGNKQIAVAENSTPEKQKLLQNWEANEGAPNPLGPIWIRSEQAYNFAIYCKYATSVTLLLDDERDIVNPAVRYQFDRFKNKTGRVWHTRIRRSDMGGTRYYAYSIDGPPSSGNRFERHAFNPHKILLDPYAKSVFFPLAFTRAAALGTQSNPGSAPLGVLCEEQDDFDWGDARGRDMAAI
jgi:isoamylase